MDGRPKAQFNAELERPGTGRAAKGRTSRQKNTVKRDLRETRHKEVPCSGRRMRIETPVKRQDSKERNSRQKRPRQTPPWRSQEEASGQMVPNRKSQAVREHGRKEQLEDAH